MALDELGEALETNDGKRRTSVFVRRLACSREKVFTTRKAGYGVVVRVLGLDALSLQATHVDTIRDAIKAALQAP